MRLWITPTPLTQPCLAWWATSLRWDGPWWSHPLIKLAGVALILCSPVRLVKNDHPVLMPTAKVGHKNPMPTLRSGTSVKSVLSCVFLWWHLSGRVWRTARAVYWRSLTQQSCPVATFSAHSASVSGEASSVRSARLTSQRTTHPQLQRPQGIL